MIKIPKIKHWVIVTETTRYTPGDERSRTHPGHGYPESYEQVEEYKYFTDFGIFEDAVAKKIFKGEKFLSFECKPIHFEVSVKTII